ncbi:hypothetical protein [Aquimarina sediminis]|uniref:hypothetical protein n=1 Tax=Aquimarina sediminis TaxID=2070536 RepID=UPI000CA05FB1|nr:hypothetical protein [Aquimarina sediminis]
MKSILFSILILSICSFSQETSQTKFEKQGVSLTYSKGWKITYEENLEDQGYYLSIEKDGLNSSGIITLSWINRELDLNNWITIYKNELRNDINFSNSNLRFAKESRDKFNTINTMSVKFTASIHGLKHEGIIHFFYENNKAFAIIKHEAIEDKTKNKDGFELIERSFTIK